MVARTRKQTSTYQHSIMEAIREPLTADPAEYIGEWIERLDCLRRDGRFCDVTVIAQGKEFTAHKIVLSAASPFFCTLLQSNMKESKEDVIKITLKEANASVMEQVLEYIYTGKILVELLDDEEFQPHNLIATADYLMIPSLKTFSCSFLQKKISIENCIPTYYIAEKYHCDELMAKSLEFINTNFTAVLATDCFLDLSAKQVTKLISSDYIVIGGEEEIFKAILRWVKEKVSKRKKEFAGLFHQVRLVSISHDYMFNEMVKEELVMQNFGCLHFVLDAMKWISKGTDEEVTQPPRKCLETHLDVILACGGKNTVCYLPEEKKWYRLADTFWKLQEHCITQYRNRVYIIGGQDHVSPEERYLEFYLPSQNIWGAVKSQLPKSKFSSLTVLKGCLYAVDHQYFSVIKGDSIVYKYDPENNSWEKLPLPPTRRFAVCSISDGQHLYLIGGATVETEDALQSMLTTTERYDPIGNQWEEVASMTKARHNAFGAAAHGKIYIAGGMTRKRLQSCEVYDPVINQWQLIGSLKTVRWLGSMVSYKGFLYVVGGHSGEGDTVDLSVEVYDPIRREWSKETDIPIESFLSQQERDTRYVMFKGCFAKISKAVITSSQPI